DPHRCNIDGLRPPANRVTACSVRIGFTGGWRGSWRPESPWLGGIGAPDLLRASVTHFRASHALAGI
ncbi:hypothetical protein, partial [Escherichia coli]|uniref:hypothetical protein n=1 Tax=Escherichia coli TaxID=562 RepID=UPI002264646E